MMVFGCKLSSGGGGGGKIKHERILGPPKNIYIVEMFITNLTHTEEYSTCAMYKVSMNGPIIFNDLNLLAGLCKQVF